MLYSLIPKENLENPDADGVFGCENFASTKTIRVCEGPAKLRFLHRSNKKWLGKTLHMQFGIAISIGTVHT